MAEKKTNTETLGFQTEVKQLLKLMIHSLYSNKEIFLRELISNSSDACDKLRFSSLTNKKLLEDEDELQISVTVDKKLKTVSISDNGIGMSKSEVIENIGTIAKSGTKEFLSKLTGDQTKDSQLIGQFGVGFYSAFIVSDLVTLITRKAGESENNGTKWISKGEGDYSVEKIQKKEKGTEIILRLKKDSVEFLESSRLKSTIQKFSDHITVPIMMFKEEWDKDKQKNIETKEFEKINQASALWVRSKSEISDKQYKEFYKHISHDFDDPLAWTHTKVEGRQDYTQLLFLPTRAPFDLWDREHKKGIKLYVKRIFIMDDADQLLPAYLRFVKGVVDSADLPLNVSREILQESKDVDSIRKGCVSRILNLLSSLLTKDIEKYKKFWDQFGKVLKEGIGEDFSNKEKISKLLLFSSTEKDTDEQTVSLTEYVKRMKKGQDKIYYVTADGYNAAKSSPHLEIFRDKGIEVLLLYDRVDEWVVSHLNEFENKKIVSVAKGNLDLGELADEEKKLKEKNEDDFKELIEKIGKFIEGKASSVRLTNRLKDSPACIVVDENAMNANLERLMKEAGQSMPNSKPILEINPNHTIIKKLKDNKDETQINDWSNLLFDQALLAEGGNLDNPGEFVKQLNKIIISLAGEDSKIWTPK